MKPLGGNFKGILCEVAFWGIIVLSSQSISLNVCEYMYLN